MRNIFLFMMVSVDGYFEGPGHDISWHNVDTEFEAFAHEQNSNDVVDTILLGHRTYDLMASVWPKPEGMAMDPETARFMNETPKIVAAHEPFTSDWTNVTVLSGDDVVSEIARLKAGPGKDMVILGSNQLCVSLMEKDLVDEFRLMVNPVALGAGTPLFTGLSKKAKLKLTKVREFKSGNVLHCYSLVK
jgi:dihydrofolate reductase